MNHDASSTTTTTSKGDAARLRRRQQEQQQQASPAWPSPAAVPKRQRHDEDATRRVDDDDDDGDVRGDSTAATPMIAANEYEPVDVNSKKKRKKTEAKTSTATAFTAVVTATAKVTTAEKMDECNTLAPKTTVDHRLDMDHVVVAKKMSNNNAIHIKKDLYQCRIEVNPPTFKSSSSAAAPAAPPPPPSSVTSSQKDGDERKMMTNETPPHDCYRHQVYRGNNLCPFCGYTCPEEDFPDGVVHHIRRYHSSTFHFTVRSTPHRVVVLAEPLTLRKKVGIDRRADRRCQRTFYFVRSKLRIETGHHQRDGLDECPNEWRKDYRDKLVWDYEDADKNEKAFLSLWNRYWLTRPAQGERVVMTAGKVQEFIVRYASHLTTLEWELMAHLTTLWEHRLLSSKHVEECMTCHRKVQATRLEKSGEAT